MIGIVIVEDESYIRKGMVMTTPWEEFGCKVIGEAGDGQEGYELIKKLKPDIVITDVSMPVMDWYRNDKRTGTCFQCRIYHHIGIQ